MNRKHRSWLMLSVVPMLVLSTAGCSGQKTEDAELMEEAPPPADSNMAGTTAPEPPPVQAEPAHPQRSSGSSRPAGTIPEERPRQSAPSRPQELQAVSVTIPAGTSVAVTFGEMITSETAQVGDNVTATLKSPLIAGDRVAFPAGSRVQGQVSDVKPATKGFKDTGGALSISFNRIVAPDGHSATVAAGFTKLAEGSAGKKAAIIGGSAAGGALLGKVLGKDSKGAALIGGAIGTAVAGGTKGKESIINADEEVSVSLERSAQTSLKP
jgi:hypothetical protein